MTEIASGDLSLGLAPEVGGSVAFFRYVADGAPVDLMRPLSAEDRARRNPVGAAMFPMLPYANRIAGNRFDFGGRTFHFTENNPPEKFNVHGTGWRLPWSVEHLAADEALLRLAHIAPGEPYSYVARQRFALSARQLTVTTEIENAGSLAMPFGFGQHPWFMRAADVRLRFVAPSLWIEGWDHVASERIRTPPEFDFAASALLPAARRNNCYGDWDGVAEIVWPARGVGLRIEADPVFRHLMFYGDPARSDFCLEPQTNAVCAFNRIGEDQKGYDLGIIVLAPGEKAAGSMRFTPFGL